MKKTLAIFIILITLSACNNFSDRKLTSTQAIKDNYVLYKTEMFGYKISWQIPDDWSMSFFSDSGLWAYFISNNDVYKIFNLEDETSSVIWVTMELLDEKFDVDKLSNEIKSDQNAELFSNNGLEIVRYSSGLTNLYNDRLEISFRAELNDVAHSEEFLNQMDLIVNTIEAKPIEGSEGTEEIISEDYYESYGAGTIIHGVVSLGESKKGKVIYGHSSGWLFYGNEGQKINLTIDQMGNDLDLTLDVQDQNGISILDIATINRTNGTVEINDIVFTESGEYLIYIHEIYFSGLGEYSISITQ